MDFSYYIYFFHDGSLLSIHHVGKNAKFKMNSAVLRPEENRDHIKLNEEGCVLGKLIVRGITSIEINRQQFTGVLTFPLDDGEVLDFDICGNRVKLGIMWYNFPPKPDKSDWWTLEIEAEKIIWEDYPNKLKVDLTGLYT